ncbi:Gfo/Idh/MocA family oxidoreductase [Paracoccaceae bacterium]|nr:Gfo/Idh/MocA family oxidoreductase [Paracoccaceae bacterium]
MRKLRVVIAGKGVQGEKRRQICGEDFVCFVDPNKNDAIYNSLNQVPLESYNAVLICVPDKEKPDLVKYCVMNGKHLIVEKPFFFRDKDEIKELKTSIKSKGVVCYTAYNHRFEPHIMAMRDLIKSKKLGEIYNCRMFYGNGTARLVRESSWRDKGPGVLPDLGSHLLDTCKFWFGELGKKDAWRVYSKNAFENHSTDHIVVGGRVNNISVQLEMTLLMWRNHFSCDILAEKGSAHIRSLCKWGPSKFIYRERVLPSGLPLERQVTLEKPDPTWQEEYKYFKKLIQNNHVSDLRTDYEIFEILSKLDAKS